MRRILGWVFWGLTIIAALLAKLQPVLGSFAFFRGGDPVDYDSLHLIVGGILYNIVIIITLLAPFTRFRHRWVLFVLCLVQYGLTHLQLRLGLGSNEDLRPLAYHIPVGVLIFFLAYLKVTLSFGPHFETSRL